MAQKPCSKCSLRFPGKPVTIYTWWYEVDGNRVSYRSQLCTDCTLDLAKDVLTAAMKELVKDASCPRCKQGTGLSPAPVRLIVYPPNAERRDYEVTYCGDCFARVRNDFAAAGELMPDRDDRKAGAPAIRAVSWDEVLP